MDAVDDIVVGACTGKRVLVARVSLEFSSRPVQAVEPRASSHPESARIALLQGADFIPADAPIIVSIAFEMRELDLVSQALVDPSPSRPDPHDPGGILKDGRDVIIIERIRVLGVMFDDEVLAGLPVPNPQAAPGRADPEPTLSVLCDGRDGWRDEIPGMTSSPVKRRNSSLSGTN